MNARSDAERDARAAGMALSKQCKHPPDRIDQHVRDSYGRRVVSESCLECGDLRSLNFDDERYALPVLTRAEVEPPALGEREHVEAARPAIDKARRRWEDAPRTGTSHGTWLNRSGHETPLSIHHTTTENVLTREVGKQYAVFAGTVEMQVAVSMYLDGYRDAIVVSSIPPATRPPGRRRGPSLHQALAVTVAKLIPGGRITVIGTDGKEWTYPPPARSRPSTATSTGEKTTRKKKGAGASVEEVKAQISTATQRISTAIAAFQQAQTASGEMLQILTTVIGDSSQPEVTQAIGLLHQVIQDIIGSHNTAQGAIQVAQGYAQRL